MNTNLHNKIITVVGNAGGTAQEIAENFLQKGVKLVILSDIDESWGKQVVEQLTAKYGENKVTYVTCVITSDLQTIPFETYKKYGHFDAIVINIGCIEETDRRKAMDWNIYWPIEYALKYWRYVRKEKEGQNGGTVLFVSSSPIKVNKFLPNYQAASFALIGFTRSLGHTYNYTRTGIRVLTLCRGLTEQEIMSKPKVMYPEPNELYQTDFDNCLESHFETKNKDIGKAAVEVFEKADSGTVWTIEHALMKRAPSSPILTSSPKLAAEMASSEAMEFSSPASPPPADRGPPPPGAGLPDWVTVRRRGAARPRAAPRPAPLETPNVFRSLSVQEPRAAQVTVAPSQARPTPIVFPRDNAFSIASARSALKAVGVVDFCFNVKPNMAQLTLKSRDDKSKALAALNGVSDLKFHSFTEKCDKPPVSVLHGIYYSNATEVAEALSEAGFKPTKVVPFKGDNDTNPRYQITLPKGADIGAFRKIRKLLDQSVRITKYSNNNKYGTMCFRCQTFGHAAANCHRPARCVKCTGAHLTKDCDRASPDVVVCCNCGGSHAASYRMCPQRQLYLAAVRERQERFKRFNTIHTPAQPRRFVSNMADGRGWASVAGTPPPPSQAISRRAICRTPRLWRVIKSRGSLTSRI